MKNLKKLLAVLVVISMVSTFLVPAFADSFSYEKEAEELYKLGLYKGTSETEYVPNLEGKLDRQTGVVMLLRLFGQEDEALEIPMEEAAATLAAKFSDAADIADWAQRQVAYAVEKGYVKGYPDGTFGPNADLNGLAFCSLILQQLGYDGDFVYDEAAYKLQQFGGLTEEQAKIFNSKEGINRDSMVGIAYSALQAVYKETGKTVIEVLVENGNVDKELALEIGVLLKPIKEVKALADVKVQIGNTPELPEEVEVVYEDDTTAKLAVAWPTVDTSELGEQEIEGTIKGANGLAYRAPKATVKVVVTPEELVVVDVKADNLKEIVIDFNGEVAEKASEKTSYSIDGNDIELVTVSDDKTSVTLTAKNALKAEEEVEITIKTATGIKEEVTKTVVPVDYENPEALSIELIGPDSFEIEFSEPVTSSSDADVIVDDGTYYVSEKTLSDNYRKLTVVLGVSSLNEGTYKVRVKGYRDFAGNMLRSKTFDLEYVKDTTAPTARIKEATQNKLVIEFNEPATRDGYTGSEAALTRDYFYHTYSSWKPTKVVASDNNKVYTLHFSETENDGSYPVYLLPVGNVTVTILKEVDDDAIVDAWGNKVESDIKLTATVAADNEAPTVKSVKAEAEDKIEVVFSEDVNKDQAEKTDNYVIKKGGKEIDESFTVEYKSDETKAVITLSEKLAGGKYTIDIKGIKDTSVSQNEMKAVTLEFEVTDKTAPTVKSVTFVGKYIYVTFSEAMSTKGNGSVLNKDNYKLYDDTSKSVEIKKIESFGSEKDKVRLTVADGVTLTPSFELLVANVEDESGNAIGAFDVQKKALANEEKPKVEEVNVISKTEIEIVVDKILDRGTIDRADFKVSRTDVTATEVTGISLITFKDGKTTIKAKLAAAVQPANSGDIEGKGYALEIVGVVKSDTGEEMEQETLSVDFADKFAPSYKSVTAGVYGSTKGFTLEFDEEIKFLNDSAGLGATDLVIKDGGKTLEAGIDYDVAVKDSNKIEVTLKGDDYKDFKGTLKVSTKETVKYITDKAGNALNKFENKEVKIN
ncbi:Ig-like domain-containing protein [Acetivibrio straminisolvens]|jgi:methionine-rich copper-binding protein CopC|uniref:Ig-like domain-containing protein n=1 Tax=Acetivibrio straminisolvens TaxID=253314 RepID=UPI00223ED91E|nr:Ig-like domain-containing protein [Acetivibrio straminisolvens]